VAIVPLVRCSLKVFDKVSNSRDFGLFHRATAYLMRPRKAIILSFFPDWQGRFGVHWPGINKKRGFDK
jgi:hypothetical protein